jgi:hypothetical protein
VYEVLGEGSSQFFVHVRQKGHNKLGPWPVECISYPKLRVTKRKLKTFKNGKAALKKWRLNNPSEEKHWWQCSPPVRIPSVSSSRNTSLALSSAISTIIFMSSLSKEIDGETDGEIKLDMNMKDLSSCCPEQ